MFQRIDFTKLGGYPLTQNTMKFLQESYNDVLAGLSRSLGDYVILSGLTETPPASNNYTDGWVTFEGEIVPFVGSLGLSNVAIQQVTADEQFGDNSTPTVRFTRKLVFSATGIPFSNFKRISLESLNTVLFAVQSTANTALTNANNALSIANTALTNANNALSIANNALSVANGSSVPSGTIVIWKGSVATIPSGWRLCDGNNGTPNLVGRFVYGANDTFHFVNAIGGSETVTLTINEMPAHQHNIRGSITGSFGGLGSVPAVNFTGYEFGGSVDPQGGNQSHNNMPPFRKLAYIMKI